MSLKLVEQNGNEISSEQMSNEDMPQGEPQESIEFENVEEVTTSALEESLGKLTFDVVERISGSAKLMGLNMDAPEKQHYASVIFTTLTQKMIFSLMEKAGIEDVFDLLTDSDVQQIEDSMKSFFEQRAAQERAMAMQFMQQQKDKK